MAHPTSPTCPARDCPSTDALARLLTDSAADDTPPGGGGVTEHVGACAGCQDRIEALATAGGSGVAGAVLHIDRADPPKDSAYWRALAESETAGTDSHDALVTPTSAEQAVTRAFAPSADGTGAGPNPPDNGDERSPVSLDFLQASDTPGMVGRLGPFDVRRVIGRGGMGVVLQGFDPWLHRDVAIKVLDPQLAGNDVARQRFCREARAAAAVANDHIVAVYQVNEDEKSGLPFLVMQLIQGESLEQRLRKVERLSVPDAVRIGMQAAAGLAAAHATGLIHRDVKPGNILLEAPTDKAKLTDFGLARAAEDLKLTRTGFVAGTPLYMAPEQARGDDIDVRADLFSLGSVMYETLAGKPPFEGRTPLAVLRRVADEAHPPLRKVNPAVPVWLENLVDRLLAKDPDDRFQTAQEVAESLAFKWSTLQTVSPLDAAAAPSGRLSTPAACTAKHKRAFCIRTAATLATVFGAGLCIGAVAVGLFMPPDMGRAAAPEAVAPQALAALPAASDQDTGPDPVHTFDASDGAVWAVALSPDGKTIAAGTESGQINLWNVTTGARREFVPPGKAKGPAHIGTVWMVEFIDDGKTLVSASDDGVVQLWDVATRRHADRPLQVPAIRSAAVSPDGKLVAVGDRSGAIWVFDLKSRRLVLNYDQNSVVNAVAFAPDSAVLASGGADGSLVIWDVPKDAQLAREEVSKTPVYGLCFSKDGAQLTTASWSPDQAAQVWNVANGRPVGKHTAQPEGAWAAPFSPSGGVFATAGQDGSTRLWDAGTGKQLGRLNRHKGPVQTARFAKDGMLVTGGRDGTVRVWDAPACAAEAAKE